jgi:hypothetical protein
MGNSDESEQQDARVEGDLQTQLLALYGDRERLHRELGTADAEEIVAMVRSLEAQLVELYRDKERAFTRQGRGSSDGPV